jgi:hypothetical protein
MAAADLPLPPARILVNADEYVFNGSRRAGPSGRWRFQLRNIGEDDHDLAVRNAAGTVISSSPVVNPGTVFDVKIRLKPGKYVLFCTISDHEVRGMKWDLSVRKPKVRTTAP